MYYVYSILLKEVVLNEHIPKLDILRFRIKFSVIKELNCTLIIIIKSRNKGISSIVFVKI